MPLLYSIWLLPQAAQEQALQAVIDSLADQHGTVRFQTHLTVCGSLRNIAALDAASVYVKQSGLLPLTATVTGVASGVESPFRAVFIEIENSPALRDFRETLRDLTGAGESIRPTSACSTRWTGTRSSRCRSSTLPAYARSPMIATRVSRLAN